MSTDVFFLGREEKLVTALKTAKVFRLEMDIYQQGTQTVTFKTEALQWP